MRNKITRVLGTLLMSAAIVVPALIASTPAVSQEVHVAVPVPDVHVTVPVPVVHVWSDSEEPYYHRYWVKTYPNQAVVVPYKTRKQAEQDAYWEWRRNNPD